MALEGNLETFYLSSLFQLLSNDKKTGRLRISHDDDVVTVNFSEGTIVFATSTDNEKHLGNLMRSEGVIGDMELENYLLIARNRKKRLGEVLVEECYISKEELTHFIRMQAENILFSIFLWPNGKFRFEDCPVSFSEETDTQFDTMDLILEASRRADELSVLREHLPPRDAILRYTPKASRSDIAKSLSLQENAVLRLVNGTRTVKEIIQQSSYDEFTACKAIHTVLTEGLVEVQEKSDFSLSEDTQQAAEEQKRPTPEKEAASFFEQQMQKSSQIQSLYEKNLKSGARGSRRAFGLAAVLLVVACAAAGVLYYQNQDMGFFHSNDAAPPVEPPAPPAPKPATGPAAPPAPETQSLQDKNAFFFLSLPAGFTAADRSTRNKSMLRLTYAAPVTIHITARPSPAPWNAENDMYVKIAELQTGKPGRARPAIEAYGLISLGGGQGYEIATTETINAIVWKKQIYKVRAHRKMVTITVSCEQCIQAGAGSLFATVNDMIRKSLLVYP